MYTRVLAVPRSIAKSFENKPKMGSRSIDFSFQLDWDLQILNRKNPAYFEFPQQSQAGYINVQNVKSFLTEPLNKYMSCCKLSIRKYQECETPAFVPMVL
jgi:hypothetical protein